MRLRREIKRELIDGNTLFVARSWDVKFAPRVSGWRVEGTQEDVEVVAPPGLEALAALERSRPTNESFPLELDHHGMIRERGASSRQVGIEQLAEAAHVSIKSREGSPREHRDLSEFLAQMQQASQSIMTRWPQDLFFPANGELSESKVMDLPGGLIGQMELIYRAETDPANGLLSSSERSVVTRIDGEELRSSEAWKLTPA